MTTPTLIAPKTAAETPAVTDTGIAPDARERVARELAVFLSDTYALYTRTQGFHWNVVGPRFEPLHGAFEAQYRELAGAVDGIAERIRALGHPAPASLEAFVHLASIDLSGDIIDADAMLEVLLRGHEEIARHGRRIVALAEDADDPASADLVTERLRSHEATAWVLRSFLATVIE